MTQRFPAEDGDGMVGVLVVGVDPALGRAASTASRLACRRLLASPVLGGYVESHVVILPASGTTEQETREVVADALAQVTPGAERYFCAVLTVAHTDDVRESVELALEGLEIRLRTRSLVVAGSARSDTEDHSADTFDDGAWAELERLIRDAVYELAEQLWDDADQAPARGMTLRQLTSRTSPEPTTDQLRSSLALPRIASDANPRGANDISEHETAEGEPEGGAVPGSVFEEDDLPDAESEEDSRPVDNHPHGESRPRGRFDPRRRWRMSSIKLPPAWRRGGTRVRTDGAPDKIVYLVLLADATTLGESWRRARAVVHAVDKALAALPEGDTIYCRYLVGGATIADRTPLQPAGAARRLGLKSAAAPYLNVFRIATDLLQIFERDSAVPGTRPGLSVVVVATSTPMIDASASMGIQQLTRIGDVIWIVLDDQSGSMLARLTDHSVRLRTDHPEIANEVTLLVQTPSRRQPQPPTQTQAGMTVVRPIEANSGEDHELR